MAKAAADHTHKYERVTIGKKDWQVYKCMKLGCAHFLPSLELAIGRDTICWGCGDIIQISKEMVQQSIKKPMCNDCREERKENRERLIAIGKGED